MLALPGYKNCEILYATEYCLTCLATDSRTLQQVLIKMPAPGEAPAGAAAVAAREREILSSLHPYGGLEFEAIHSEPHGVILAAAIKGLTPLRRYTGGRPLSLAQFLPLAAGLVGIIARLHRLGLIHGDFNPDVLLLDEQSNLPYLCDCSRAVIAGEAGQDLVPYLPAAGQSFAYLAPEQTGRLNRPVDRRSDIYSLGVILYELATGCLPVNAGDTLEWFHALVAGEIKAPGELESSIPDVVSAIIMKCLARDPEQRYQSAAGVESDLLECLARWQQKGRVDSFTIGQRDNRPAITFGSTFVGRERELGVLQEALEQAARGAAVAVLIGGEAGSGKTRLVQEFMHRAGNKAGFSIAGKFEALQSAVPYQPVTSALDQALERILAGSSEDTAGWRRLITAGLGIYASALTAIMPRLGELAGEQPQLAAPTILQEQQRFLAALVRLVDLLARQGAPLVFFLDDLQWADRESLRMLTALLIENRIQHLLFIGAFRATEAAANRPLSAFLQAIERGQGKGRLLALAPARQEEITALVAASLGCRPEEAGSLSEFLHRQTGGNLLFVRELLASMYNDGLVVYRGGEEGWSWDWQRLPDMPYAGDLIRFLLEKLERLEPETRAIIRLAACAGVTFTAWLLRAASGLPSEAVAGHLERCLTAGLIGKKGAGIYSFVHDRVHQAVYLSLPAGEREEWHYRLGNLLLHRDGTAAGREDTAGLLAAVNQLNLGLAVLVDKGENIRGAALNLKAGQKAKKALAFSAALEYLRTGLSLLDDGAWKSNYSLIYALTLERVECEYLCDHLDTAEALYAGLVKKARTVLDRTAAHLIRIPYLTRREMFAAAITTGLQGLQELGCHMPARPSWWHILPALAQCKFLLHRTGVNRLAELPPVRDREVEATVNLLMAIGPATYLDNQDLLALISLQTAAYSLRYGNGGNSGSGYMATAMILLHSLGDYRTAAALARAALELADARGILVDKYMANFLYGAFIHPWLAPLKDSETFLLKALEYSLAVFDLTYGGYAMNFHIVAMFSAGAPLPELEARIGAYSRYEPLLHDTSFSSSLAIFRQFSRALQGLTRAPSSFSDAAFDDAAFYGEISSAPERQREVFDYCLCKGQIYSLFGDYRRAFSLLDRAGRLAKLYYGVFYLADQVFYYCLAGLGLYSRLRAHEKAVLWLRLLKGKRRLERWARHCPANFEARHLLVAAEMARVARREQKAVRLYERAVRSARENGFPHIAALALERAAAFYRERGLETPAREYLRAARDAYRAWGATAKVEQLQSLDPWLAGGERDQTPADRHGETGRNLTEEVDLKAVYRAAQVLAGTIVLEELLPQMMEVTMQNAGADRAAFLVQRDGRLYLEARAASSEAGIVVELLPSQPLELAGMLPRSIITRAVAGGETIVLDNAALDPVSASDPVLAGRDPLSVLCLPVARQGRPVGVLYLENSVTAGCFHPGRVEALQLLAGQIAIAVENAALYRSLQQVNATLEDKVRERTESLARLQKETLDAFAEKSRLEERNRIAREIHDTVGHTLTSVLVQIEAVRRLLPKDTGQVGQKLEQCQEQLRKGLDDIRRSLRLLKGSGAAGGVPDLETFIHEVMQNTGVSIAYRIDPLPRLDPVRRYVLYRALQEGITNGIRHGGSRSFSFSLVEENGMACFLLRDYGSGAEAIRPGFGLTSMRERVEELRGEMAVTAAKGEGCCLQIILPLK